MALVDICVNLFNSQLKPDRTAMLERARLAGVSSIVITATDLDTATQAARFCEQPPENAPLCICTAGIHPHDANLAHQDSRAEGAASAGTALPDDWQEQLEALARNQHVRAIGETGLDFYRNFVPQDEQRQVFEAQISLAQQLNKPLFVHDRDTNGEVLRTLTSAGTLPPVVVHCFTGSREELEGFIEAGFYIGITGWIADPERGQQLRELVGLIPIDQLLLETDAPFLKPKSVPQDLHLQNGLTARHKRRNEPAYLPFVADAVAGARNESIEELALHTSQNARRFFRIDEQ